VCQWWCDLTLCLLQEGKWQSWHHSDVPTLGSTMQDTSACVHSYLVGIFLNEMKRGGNVWLWLERGRLRLFQWHLHWYFYWLWTGVSKWRGDFVIWKEAKILILIIIKFLKDLIFFHHELTKWLSPSEHDSSTETTMSHRRHKRSNVNWESWNYNRGHKKIKIANSNLKNYNVAS